MLDIIRIVLCLGGGLAGLLMILLALPQSKLRDFLMPIVGWAFGRDLSAAAALCYAGFAAIALAFLRGDDGAGLRSMLFLFAVVWATDIAAYAVGRTLGGPKLAPSISPGKTWSGAIGGAVAGIAAGLGTAALAGIGITGLLAATALLLTIVSQAGDLFESAVKRHFGVKDSSNVIPGHGGLLDRLDGFVAAIVIAAAIGLLRSDDRGLSKRAHDAKHAPSPS